MLGLPGLPDVRLTPSGTREGRVGDSSRKCAAQPDDPVGLEGSSSQGQRVCRVPDAAPSLFQLRP